MLERMVFSMKKRCGLLGERLAHSYSPQIHAELSDYEYRLYEKKPEELEAFLRHGDFDGLNVTIPYKKDVIPYCRSLSEAAHSIGSVNTLTRQSDGSLHGDNTDYFGFAYLLKKIGVKPEGKVLILGNGGSSLTVQAVLNDRNFVVVSRKGENNYSNIEKHHDAIMIINTTPVGMYPNNGVSPISDLAAFKNCRAVTDLIYNPARTELFMQAEELGIPCINGLAMLVAQAKKAAELFTGAPIADDVIDTITEKIARETRNIVLIGMPGCGKTSIGVKLARILRREFADSDDLIKKTAGKSIPAVFEEDGEEVFRKLESETLNELCKQSGLVIATGGGVVTKAANKRTLRQNGIVVFLDRDIRNLPVSDRPLSKRDGVESLASVRLPLYADWSDCTVPVIPGREITQTAEDIILQLSCG